MYAQRYQEGAYIDYTPSGAALAPGDVKVIGDFCAVCERDVPIGELGALATRGIFKVAKAAPLAITAGDSLYWNASSKTLSKTSTDVYWGKAVLDAGSTDTIVYAWLISPESRTLAGLGDLDDVGTATATEGNVLIGDGADFNAGKLGVISAATTAEGAMGIPIIMSKTVTASGAADTTVVASTTVKMRILNAFFYSRDVNEANVKLHSGTAGVDDITDALAKGTVSAVRKQWLTLVTAKATPAAGSAIKCNFSAAGSVEVVIIAVPSA